MKKLILIGATIIAINSVYAQADAKKVQGSKQENKGQNKQTPEQRAQRSVDHLDKVVTLTPDQKTKVYDLALTRAKKTDEIRTKYKGKKEQHENAKSEIKANHKEYREAVKAILTSEQMIKVKEKARENKGKGKGKGENPVEAAPATPSDNEVNDAIPSDDN